MIRNLTFLICLPLCASVLAEDWPCWRGPRGDGTSTEVQIPVEWNGETGEGIAWKTEIPGKGHSSPIVRGKSIFLTTCLEDSHERMLLCLNRNDGSLRWKASVAVSPLETKHELNSFASGTPATDGKTVYVTFLVADDRGTVNCFDTANGHRLWQERLGNHYSGSLVAANGLAYFPADDGITAVVKPGVQMEVLHRNPLGEYSYASPAISNGQIFIRGERHLFAIGTDSLNAASEPR